MANRTELVCLCEGTPGRSIDSVFINSLIRTLNPVWLRASGSNRIRVIPKGGRNTLIEAMPKELRSCLKQGGHTTLMVWADLDHDMADGDALKAKFWSRAQSEGITSEDFEKVVFIFAKDRLENWIQFIRDGSTDENSEGPRVRDGAIVAEAARSLARICQQGDPIPNMPPSLEWSCKNWRNLVKRMRS